MERCRQCALREEEEHIKSAKIISNTVIGQTGQCNLKTISLIKDWDWPDLFRQTPGNRGIWQDISITLNPVEKADYVIVLNRVPQDVTVRCPKGSIWAIIQEPPVPEYEWLRKGFTGFDTIFTPDSALVGPRYRQSHGALPWMVNKCYDDLKKCPPPAKERKLSWITSSAQGRQGRIDRLSFLDYIRQKNLSFDLWGRGFQPINDKWDGLAPYRYALAIENHSGPHYWTEKIMDVFLSWTMPIYYGCTRIYDYFPKESLVLIDITKPEEALLTIIETINSDQWRKNRDAIAYARELILDKYQLFPFLREKISEFESENKIGHQNKEYREVHLNHLPYLYPSADISISLRGRIREAITRIIKKMLWFILQCIKAIGHLNDIEESLEFLYVFGLKYRKIIGFKKIPGWLLDVQAVRLFDMASSIQSNSPRIMEIGGGLGKASFILARGIEKNKKPQLFCVDPFDVDDAHLSETEHQHNYRLRKALKGSEKNSHLLTRLTKNIKKKRAQPLITILVGCDHSDSSHSFSGTIDLLFIDGNHRYETVKKNYDKWIGYLKPGGVLILHDVNVDSASNPTGAKDQIGPALLAREKIVGSADWHEIEITNGMLVARKS